MTRLVLVLVLALAGTAHAAGFTKGEPIGNGGAPAAAIANDGQVFVAWIAPSLDKVYTARRGPTDKKFTKQLNVGGNNVVPLSLSVVRHSGTAAVAWTEGSGGNTRVRVAVANPNFKDPETFPGGSDPSLALADDGTLLIAYTAGTGVSTAVRPPGGPFGAPRSLATGSAPQAAWTPSGWRVVWLNQGDVSAAAAGADGVFGTPVQLSADARPAEAPLSLAGNRGGELVAAWMTETGGAATIDAAIQPGSGSFLPSATVSAVPANGALDLHTSVNPAGDALIAWHGESTAANFNDQLGTAFRPAGGAFGQPLIRADLTDPWAPIAAGLDAAGGSFIARAAGTEAKTVTASLAEREAPPGGDVAVSKVPERGLAGLAAATDPFGNGVIAWGSTELGRPMSVATYSRAAPKPSDIKLSRTGLSVTLDEPGRLVLQIQRGRRSVSIDRVAVLGAGQSTVRFSKRIRRFVRRAGKYKLTLVMTDAGPDERVVEVRRRRS